MDTLFQIIFFKVIQINNIRGDLTDFSPKRGTVMEVNRDAVPRMLGDISSRGGHIDSAVVPGLTKDPRISDMF